MPEPVLSIRDLAVQFTTDDGTVRAVDGVTYDVFPGETLGIVGESGSGKSVSTMSILGLIPQPPGRIVSGEAIFNGRDLLKLSKKELRRTRGNDMAIVFQDPMTSLNPVLKVGFQIGEAMRAHHPEYKDGQIKEKGMALLRTVGIGHTDDRQQANRALACGLAVDVAVRAHRLGDLVADLQDRVERRHRILEHHRDVAAADSPQLPLRHLQEVLPVEVRLAGDDLPGRLRDQPENRELADAFP